MDTASGGTAAVVVVVDMGTGAEAGADVGESSAA